MRQTTLTQFEAPSRDIGWTTVAMGAIFQFAFPPLMGGVPGCVSLCKSFQVIQTETSCASCPIRFKQSFLLRRQSLSCVRKFAEHVVPFNSQYDA